ncbi:ANKHD1 [Symbiodinium sp. KB8]|nr:ANKHD1 [Symbiodinium sp. KB8]
MLRGTRCCGGRLLGTYQRIAWRSAPQGCRLWARELRPPVRRLAAQGDPEASPTLSTEELALIIPPRNFIQALRVTSTQPHELRKAFDRLDIDESGTLCFAELRALIAEAKIAKTAYPLVYVPFVPAAMASTLHVWMVSGSEVASIPKEELSDVRSLKQRLQGLSGTPRFRQELCKGGAVLEDSEILQTSDVQLLLLPYAETSQYDEDKLTADAAFGCFAEIERVLLLRHDPNVVDSILGLSPLYYASERGHLEIVRLLLEACADADFGDRRHDITPLLAASRNGRVDIAKLLLEAGADKQRCNCRGETPLWVASCRGNTDMVRLLLDTGLNVDQADNSGETPLCVACRFGREEIVCLLRQAGSDIFRTNRRGDSPLSLAIGQRTGPVSLLLCCWRPALALLGLLRSAQGSRVKSHATDEELDRATGALLARYDRGKDGALSFKEFEEAVLSIASPVDPRAYALAAAIGIAFAGFSVTFPMGPTLIQTFGMSQLQFGTLTTAFAIAKLLGVIWGIGTEYHCSLVPFWFSSTY